MDRYVSEWVRLKLVRKDGNSLVPIKPLSEIIKHLNKEVEVNYGCKVTSLEERNESVEITVKNQDEINKYQYDRVIVALPIEQAINICNPLGLEINGVSDSTWVVWGPSDKIDLIPGNWESYYHNSGSGVMEVRIRNDEIDVGDKLNSKQVIDFVTDKLGVDSSNWRAHYWKYAIPVDGPREILHTDRISIIGDCFGQPLGTVGGAIESSGRVVSEIHLSKLNF